MRIAYLVNQYPKISHSFIRREIEGVERAGVDVVRISIRRTEEPLVDPRDIAERECTQVVLDRGGRGLLTAVMVTCVSHPLRFARAVATAMRLGWRSKRGLAINLVYLAEASILRRMLVANEIDHVHAHFATNPASVALLCHELGGPPFSFTFHGPEFFEFPTHAGLGLKVAAARFSVAISHHGRSQLMRFSGRQHWPRIAIVHCGVEREYLDHASVPIPSEPRLVCVARIDPAKGHLVLLDAAALLAAEGRKFEIALVGDGDLRATIELAVRARQLEKHVRFLGWQSGEAVKEQILAARALVLPSFEEGLPVVFMEALALERPVVSTYIAGIPELVRPGVSGWLVPASCVGELAIALREVLDAKPEELQQIGRRGAALVRDRHDAEREARVLAQLFENTVHESRKTVNESQVKRSADIPMVVHSKSEAS